MKSSEKLGWQNDNRQRSNSRASPIIQAVCGKLSDHVSLRNRPARDPTAEMIERKQTRLIVLFTSVGRKTVDKINSLASKCNYNHSKLVFVPRKHPAANQFNFKFVECSEVASVVRLMPLNKSPGIDKIPARVIKDCLPAVLPTLTSIINASFATGIFPCSWKMAEVSPILKDRDFEDPKNYRPISLLPTMSKICERIALNQLMPYLLSNKRLSATQSGNKKNPRD